MPKSSKSLKSGKTLQSKSKHRKFDRPAARRTASQKMQRLRTVAATPSTSNINVRAKTKQGLVIAALQEPAGATINAMMRITGWQQHSVRGFLAAVVRKKLGLDLESKATQCGRIYWIKGTAPSVHSTKTTA